MAAYRKYSDSLELLERMLNRTTLSTKRVTHNNILGKWLFMCRDFKIACIAIINDLTIYKRNRPLKRPIQYKSPEV